MGGVLFFAENDILLNLKKCVGPLCQCTTSQGDVIAEYTLKPLDEQAHPSSGNTLIINEEYEGLTVG